SWSLPTSTYGVPGPFATNPCYLPLIRPAGTAWFNRGYRRVTLWGRDQVAEHLRAGREAVQEQYRRRVFRPGLAVEDVQVAGLDRPVGHFRRLDPGISRVRVRGQ